MALTKRAKAALEVLKSGGYFRKQLETTWHGEKFVTRLRAANGAKVPGFGFKTFEELRDAGVVEHRPCETSSVWPEEHMWNRREP